MLRLKTIAQDNGIDSRSSPTRSTRYKSGGRKPAFLLRSFYYSGYRHVICLYKITVFTLKQVIISVNFELGIIVAQAGLF